MALGVSLDILNQKGTPAFFSDIFANRPAFGFAGRVFISTDTGAIYEDTGTAWTLIADAGAGTTGTLQQVTTNGNTTTQGISITAGGLSANSITNTSLTTGSVAFVGAAGLMTQDNANFFWDNTNKYLGIGNTGTPTAPLDIHNGTVGQLIQLNATSTNNSNIGFLNASVSKWRIGNVYNAGANDFNIFNNTLTANALSINSTNNYATFARQVISKEPEGFLASPATTTSVASFKATNSSGYITLGIDSSTGGNFNNGAYSRWLYCDGVYPLDFYTQALIRMRLSSSGNLIIANTPTTDNGNKLQITGTSTFSGTTLIGTTTSNSGGLLQSYSPNGTNAINGQVANNNNATLVGFDSASNYTFYVLGTGSIYSTSLTITLISSDINLKTDIKDYDKGLNEILAMKPRYYKYKNNLLEEKSGFIAQEMDEAVSGSMIDSPMGNHKTYQIEWYPLLVKAIQELNEKLVRNNIN
jgi:hypothetical protein